MLSSASLRQQRQQMVSYRSDNSNRWFRIRYPTGGIIFFIPDDFQLKAIRLVRSSQINYVYVLYSAASKDLFRSHCHWVFLQQHEYAGGLAWIHKVFEWLLVVDDQTQLI